MIPLILMLAAVAGETELEARAAVDVPFPADWRPRWQPGDVWCDRHQKWCPKQHKKQGGTVMATVVGRHVFYPGSNFGDQIDPTKSALLPGGTGAFANYVSYCVGYAAAFRGIYVDIDDLAAPGAITAADFVFVYGNDNDPSGWSTATAPNAVTVTEGAGVGGSDRIKITWSASAMPNSRWLQVTVLANANTGLAIADVHYWGLAAGEIGNSATDAEVDIFDEQGVAGNISPDPVPITSPYDIDKSGYVTLGDRTCVVVNYTNEETGTALLLITVPLGPVAGPYGVDAGEVFHAGATAGQGVVTGQRAGEVFHTGGVAGQIKR